MSIRLTALILGAIIALCGCAAFRTKDIGFAMQDYSGATRAAFYVGEGVRIYIVWQDRLDTGRTVKCDVTSALDGRGMWTGVGTLPKLGSPMPFSPTLPEGGLKLPAGAYVTQCNFSDVPKAAIVHWSVSPLLR